MSDESRMRILRPDKIYAIERQGETVTVVLSNGETVCESQETSEDAEELASDLEKSFRDTMSVHGSNPDCIECGFVMVPRGDDYYCGRCERKYKDWEVANEVRSSDVSSNSSSTGKYDHAGWAQ